MTRAAPLPPDERRAAIIAATEPLLEIHGRNVSTRQIAEAAQIAEGTIFRVFPSKEALLDAVVNEAFDTQVTCSELRAIGLDQPLEQRLVQAVTLLQERLRRVFALFHALALSREVRPQREIDARHQTENALLNAALAELIEPDRDQLTHDPADAASLLRALAFTATHPVLSDPRHADPRQIVHLLLYGITHRPPDPQAAPC